MYTRFIICLVLSVVLFSKDLCVYDVKCFPRITLGEQHLNEIVKETDNITNLSNIKRPNEVWVNDGEKVDDFMKSIGANDQWIVAWDNGGEWWNYPIMLNDTLVPGKTEELCPVTSSVLKQMKGIKIAGFSRLNKGGYIQPHWDSNGKKKALAYHLGLVGRSYLKVSGTRLEQYPGSQFIFDSEFLHSARNDTNTDRILLYILFDKEIHYTKQT